jgi:aryl-alcohol dehydrogenase-like predicted oxidoreductase
MSELRKLGKSDMQVSSVTFGAWEIGGFPFYKNQSEKFSEKIINEAYELGINFFDTAPVYGFGLSEKIIGRAVKKFRDKIYISTKCGLRWREESIKSIYTNARKDSIKYEIDMSLKRLGLDYIDLYLLHWPDKDSQAPIGESIEALEKLKDSGKIRYYGVSNYNLGQLKEAMRYGDITCIQNHYSLLKTDFEKTLGQFVIENNIGVQAYSPLERGVLTNKSFDELLDKKEAAVNWILKEQTNEKREKLRKIKSIASKLNLPVSTLTIAVTIKRPSITTAIVGTQNINHLKEALHGIEANISDEINKEINEIID